MIIARSDHEIDDSLREKISLFCDVECDHVIPMKTASSLYEVPLMLEGYGVGEKILNYFDLEAREKPDWSHWKTIIKAHKDPRQTVTIALVGKYVELHDAYMSVKEALVHAGLNQKAAVDIRWVHSAKLESGEGWEYVKSADGILVPGGFGDRGIEGKIMAIQFARENNVPYLGLCLGMQLMVVEFARHLLGDKSANSTEFNKKTQHPVIDLMPDQRNITDKGGTMRLGLYPCKMKKGTKAFEAYKKQQVDERHRHRYEVNNDYRQMLEDGGLVFSGQSPDGFLAEISEVQDHPFMLGCQFHPEFLSRPNRPHPLFRSFIQAALERKMAGQKK
jgi:CTP synthase